MEKLIKNILSKKSNDIDSLNQAFELLRIMFDEDEKKARELSLKLRNIVARKMNNEQWYLLYRKILLLRAPYVFDDYMIFLEIDRAPRERFYQPRRKKLKKVVELLQAMEDDELDELFLSEPPRVGKSTTINMFLTWIMGRNSERTNLYSAFSSTITGTMYNGVIEIITDESTYNWKKIFPESGIANKDGKETWIDIDRAKKYHSLTCRSLYGTLNGACDCNGYLISDDLIGGIEEALNPERLKGAWSKVTNNLIPRAKMKAKKIWIGTRWSLIDPIGLRKDTLANTKENSKIRWHDFTIPALDENDESNFDFDFDVGFDTQYYKGLRSQFERNNDIASWNAQYQGEPIEREGALFTVDTMNFYNGVIEDEIYKTLMAVDIAYGGGDYVSAPICVSSENGDYIADVVFDNGDKYVTRPKIVKKIIEWGVKNVQFEKNNGGDQYGEWIEEELKRLGYRCNITYKSAPTTKRKEQRIFDNAPDIRMLYFLNEGNRSKEYQLFMNNVYSFKIQGKNKNDDAPDSLAMLVEMKDSNSNTKTEIFKREILGI